MQYKIGVTGTFIRDTIITLDRSTVESIGGLYHSMAYLCSLASKAMAIYPMCNIGSDFYGHVKEALAQFDANVRFDYMQQVEQPNTCVKLIYRSAEARDEITTATMPAVTPQEMLRFSQVDSVLVNLISGDDVELEGLNALKSQLDPPLVYLDLHSLVLGIDRAGKRYYREVPQWREWISSVDILQVNEKEAATLGRLSDPPSDAELIELGKSVAGEYVKACHITLGSRGSLLFYRNDRSVQVQSFGPAPGLKSVDIIGCGDAFGAAFVVHFIRSSDYVAATRFANKIAGLNCTFLGSLTPEKFNRYIKPTLIEQDVNQQQGEK